MNNKINFCQVMERLEENSLPYGVLSLQNGFKIVIMQHGGRIFGPFSGENGESILWMNQCFAKKEDFRAFIKSGDWNLGGDRIWLAPELQYNVKDRSHFFDSYSLPQQVDPGNYSLEMIHEKEYSLRQGMRLEVYQQESDGKDLYIERRIRQTEDPLQYLKNHEEMMNGVYFAGYEHEISLREKYRDDIMSEPWNLTQINPGGELLISSTPNIEYTDYYEPVDDTFQTIYPGYVRLEISGDRRYKVGYKAANILGRIGYYNQTDPDEAYLLVRNFFSNPSAPYTKEPAGKPGCNGHSLHVYNDSGESGGSGGFAELECSGQPIGGITGKSSGKDQIFTWLYQGKNDQIKKIVYRLLGISL